MDIFLVTTTLTVLHDSADAFVVQALNANEAFEVTRGRWGDLEDDVSIVDVTVKKIGVSTADLPVQKIILRSFNAG